MNGVLAQQYEPARHPAAPPESAEALLAFEGFPPPVRYCLSARGDLTGACKRFADLSEHCRVKQHDTAVTGGATIVLLCSQ